MKKQHVHMLIGFILGLVLPFLVGGIIVENRAGMDINLMQYNVLSFAPFLQLGAIANLGIFFLFSWLNKQYIQRGIVAATILIMLGILYLKFIY